MLKDQRILITGANGGIGTSICEILLQNNANLVLLYNQKRDNIDKLLKMYGNSSSVETQQVDLLDNHKLENIMNLVLKSGQIDTFIHSATLAIKIKRIMDIRW